MATIKYMEVTILAKNRDGEAILNWPMAFDLQIANTYFVKEEEHSLWHRRVGLEGRTQIDYMLLYLDVEKDQSVKT